MKSTVVYLIHFERPYKRARHYLGMTKDIDERIRRHVNGNGARLLQVLNENKIGWAVVRIWKNGSRKLERKLKAQKNAPRLCPICNRKGNNR